MLGGTFVERALGTLNIEVDLAAEGGLPANGPLVVVANHPHGMVDGLAMADVVMRNRKDVRILTTNLLAPIPELAELCLYVDAFGGPDSASRSFAGLRAAVEWLDDGHALVVFPAGEVSHLKSPRGARTDSPWHDTVARLALRTGATLVPAFIEGHNRVWFYRAGRLHAALRTLLLARELLAQRGTCVSVHLGPPARAVTGEDSVGLTRRLRAQVDRLGESKADSQSQPAAAIVDAQPADQLDAEIRALPKEARLLTSGRFEVFCTTPHVIPHVLREIGRLREISFRAVGEGTGRTIDLDRFDHHYMHLFVWNRDQREVVGAYRIGATDEILASHGVDGLYTSTLFRYDARLLSRLPAAVELGRSFVRAEYQRSNALLLLWKGIANFVARSGKYRVLFGPVSISSRYSDTSQQLLKAFLKQNAYDRDLGALVQALTPPSDSPVPSGIAPQVIGDIGALDTVITRLEADGKGVPILLRQYLKLNARLLGFNVDPAFGNALDALMMVDLAEVEHRILRRYFGDDASAFLSALPRAARPAAA